MDSRYIPVKIATTVSKESNFKCALCGVVLTEIHHIEPYSISKDNSADNLILLCPSCHTNVHQGVYTKEEILERKKELKGIVTRSSGALLINGNPEIRIGGTLFLGGIERVVSSINRATNIDYLKIVKEKENLLISLRIHDNNSNLIFFMHNNMWWVEHENNVDYNSTKNSLQITVDSIDSWFKINIDDNLVEVSCKMYINGQLIEFARDRISVGTITSKIERIHGNKTSIAIAVV